MVSTLISVAVPVYNEGERLAGLLRDLGERLAAADQALPSIELIVVDDGSRADMAAQQAAAVRELAGTLGGSTPGHRASYLPLERNQGKAAAIRAGWAHSSPNAQWLGFLDADGAVPAREFLRLCGSLGSGQFDALAGSRIRMAGHQIHRTAFRHLQGRVFATFVEFTFGLGLYDPQCGVKFFRAAMIRPFLERMHENTWLLDVEALSIVKRQGGHLKEEPIDWSDPGGSKVTFGIDPARMLLGLFELRRRLDRELGS